MKYNDFFVFEGMRRTVQVLNRSVWFTLILLEFFWISLRSSTFKTHFVFHFLYYLFKLISFENKTNTNQRIFSLLLLNNDSNTFVLWQLSRIILISYVCFVAIEHIWWHGSSSYMFVTRIVTIFVYGMNSKNILSYEFRWWTSANTLIDRNLWQYCS